MSYRPIPTEAVLTASPYTLSGSLSGTSGTFATFSVTVPGRWHIYAKGDCLDDGTAYSLDIKINGVSQSPQAFQTNALSVTGWTNADQAYMLSVYDGVLATTDVVTITGVRNGGFGGTGWWAEFRPTREHPR
jgi:hypothetical protein